MSTLDERKSKSFDVVLDAVKLLITLSTAIIGYFVSAILIHKDDKDSTLEVLKKHSGGMTWALSLLAACVLLALFTILKISGMLGDETTDIRQVTVYDDLTRLSFGLCLLCFLVAIFIMGGVAFSVLHNYNSVP